ncbi:MAG: hypothetical protein H0V88_12825 [Pyrinomonadaceae bacterium]|nr:hypothetical protein [Pyrinomonadaceae bacterium]
MRKTDSIFYSARRITENASRIPRCLNRSLQIVFGEFGKYRREIEACNTFA